MRLKSLRLLSNEFMDAVFEGRKPFKSDKGFGATYRFDESGRMEVELSTIYRSEAEAEAADPGSLVDFPVPFVPLEPPMIIKTIEHSASTESIRPGRTLPAYWAVKVVATCKVASEN